MIMESEKKFKKLADKEMEQRFQRLENCVYNICEAIIDLAKQMEKIREEMCDD